jgi:DNA polymerase-3 subunit epsilon
MLPCFVMLDLETTGGSAANDRITEIAAVRVENGVEVARWSSLVNPQTPIPPFIQSLTGITDAMVANAPTFETLAPALFELLDGAVFVAHNVRFDHGFVQQALERLNRPLKVKTLCTVRLSRKLYPQHKGHGLDAITQRHGLHNQARHRAMGDVDVVLAWLALATQELGVEVVRREAHALLQGGNVVPPQLETPVDDIPETTGVYLLWGAGPAPLFIGKASNLRARVMWHFQSAAKVAREMRIAQEIRRVEWRETADELSAFALESRLKEELQPRYNRKARHG